MLYCPAAFREDDAAVLGALIAGARLATLVSNGPGGLPDISHLPLLLEGEAIPGGTLTGHLARANPHAGRLRDGDRAVAVFQAAEAYVSPGWYASKAEHHRVVPTWNYEVVHVQGRIERVEAAAPLRDIVAALTSRHEHGREVPWAVDDAPEAFVAGQLRGIVGIRLHIERVSGKRKLSQNRSEADRSGVIEGLRDSDDARDRAAAAAMQAAASPRA